MNLFKQLFGKNKKNDDAENTESPYMPDKNIPVDEMFMQNFIKNGGKFVYCISLAEIAENFINILEENDWFEKEAICFDNRLTYLLDENKITYKTTENPTFLLCSCENLIADKGSILFSSNQLKEFKMDEIPKNLIVYATTSQLVNSKGDGLRTINRKYTNRPTNITTITLYKEPNEEDFLQYGSTYKNLYLLLLEDL
ncbi:LUD domain-containing protein [Flavobacterium sp.]|uniref:LUD domain-containing protein n=1 Tax=Flavobacterium sp. TaxID=239 RepID=UPI003529878B